MGSFLASLITPWTQRPQTANPANAFWDAQQQEQENALAQAKLDEEKRKNLATEETTRQHVEGTNKYYDIQAQTHREDVEQRHQDKLEKDFAMAHAAMMKAKTPEERKLAMGALSRAGAALGYTAAQEPSAAPGLGAAGGAPNTPSTPDHGVEKYAAYMEGRQRDPKLQSYLDQMGKETGLGPAPMPWEGLGAAPGAGAASGEAGGASSQMGNIAAPKGPSKFVLRDKNGTNVYEWDEPLLHHQNAQALEQSAAAAMGGALTPEESKAVHAAAESVAPFLDQMTPKEAMDEMAKRVNTSLGQFKKHGPAGTGGAVVGPGVPGKEELKRLKIVQDEENTLISKHLGVEKAADLSKAEQALNAMDAALTAGGGMNQILAMVEQVKAANGRAAAQQEFKAIQGASGAMANLETLVQHYTDPQGNISEDTVRQMRDYLNQMRRAIAEDRARIAEGLKTEFATSAPLRKMMTPDEISAFENRIAGHGSSPPAGGRAAPAAGTGDERKKKALDAARKALGQ